MDNDRRMALKIITLIEDISKHHSWASASLSRCALN
jgi:hypothetical protein